MAKFATNASSIWGGWLLADGGCEENLNNKSNLCQRYLRKYLWGGWLLAGGAWVRRIGAAEDYPDDLLAI